MINKEKKPNKVYDSIKEAILYMKIKPGESIGEIDVANYFGVSRTPVRDAFKKLEADGLVEIKSHIGTFVSLIDLEHIVDTIFMREHIEKAIIRSLAENSQPAHYLKLSYVLDLQKQLLDSGLSGQEMAAKFMELDNEFHRLMFELAGRENVWHRLQAQRHHYDRFRIFLNNDDREKLTRIYHQHSEIVKHIRERQPQLAMKIYEEHVYYNVMNSTQTIMENKKFFKGFSDTEY